MNRLTESGLMLEGIAIRARSRAPMQELSNVHISTQAGVEGDCRGRPGQRQVTVLSAESWQQAGNELDTLLPWITRRANLLISGRTFGAEDVNKVLVIGDVHLKIMRETDPCGRMDQAAPGLRAALTPQWRGGVCCRVLQSGDVRVGDVVTLLDV